MTTSPVASPSPPTTDPPLLRCGEGGPTDHVAAATHLVRYLLPVNLSAAGETWPAYLLTCNRQECLEDAIRHAEAVSPRWHEVASLALVDRAELEDLTGYDLTGYDLTGWVA